MEAWEAEGVKICDNDIMREFAYHVFEHTCLVDHGGGVVGSWLNAEGNLLLADLDEWLASDEAVGP